MRGLSFCRARGAAPLIALILGLAVAGCVRPDSAALAPPSAIYQELFSRVQSERLFQDSKTFADAVPRRPPARILARYRSRPVSRDQLAFFVHEHFRLPADDGAAPASPGGGARDLQVHIAQLWPLLTRPPVDPPPFSSQLQLTQPHVVPGGRFRETYYWDTYFTMLGLVRDGHAGLAQGMTNEFAGFIRRFGFVPNGARTYYLSRSQPPVFYLMVSLAFGGPAGYARHLDSLRLEHAFWMRGGERLRPGEASERAVRLSDGSLLNRYWDSLTIPRDEAYRLDASLAARSGRPPAELFRDIRAAAESGWDFSSRWLADGHSLETIETTAIVPVDLNSLLFGLEKAIAQGCRQVRDLSCEAEFMRRAADRRDAISRHLWDSERRVFLDYHWRQGRRLVRPSGAMLYPLFVGLADQAQADGVAAFASAHLVSAGGLRATTVRTGQQWDAPNGWAPLQWIGVRGLVAYDKAALAEEIAIRWMQTVCRNFGESGRLLEKYDVETVRPGGGGEYPLQDGFGWTNGVTREFIALYGDSYRRRAPAEISQCLAA